MAKKRVSRKRRTADLGPREQLARARALEALARMRNKRVSLAQGARESQTSPRTVTKYAASALRKMDNGQHRAKPSDRLLRQLQFPTAEGLVPIDVRSSRIASLIADYSNAVKRYVLTGLTDQLEEYSGKFIKVGKQHYPFITDPRTLNRLANAGEVAFEDLYARVS